MIRSIKLTNLLSFGPDSPELELRPLNVLIGPNGSGKSNLIEAIRLLQAAPSDLSKPVRGLQGGGIGEWLWKGKIPAKRATLVTVTNYPRWDWNVCHRIVFAESIRRLEIREESIELMKNSPDDKPVTFYKLTDSGAAIGTSSDEDGAFIHRNIAVEDLNMEQSILSQRNDPDQYPALDSLLRAYSRIRIYSNWSFGRNSPQRLPQPTDGRTDFLSEDCDNLGLVLSSIRTKPVAKRRFLEALSKLFDGVEDFGVRDIFDTVQPFLKERGHEFPATRLSDGTLRYLCLLAILCHPTPPPLICIEEPEIGLHPDVIPEIAGLLVEASERTQLIVTTHSDMLVDCLTETPESIVVCEKENGQTMMRRLSKEKLRAWLDDDYTLGPLWTKGVLGGNRW